MYLAQDLDRLLQDSNMTHALPDLITRLLWGWIDIPRKNRTATRLAKQRLLAMRSIMNGVHDEAHAYHATEGRLHLRLAGLETPGSYKLCTWRSSHNLDEELVMGRYVRAMAGFWHQDHTWRSDTTDKSWVNFDLAFEEFTMRDALAQIFDFFDDWALFVGMRDDRASGPHSVDWMDVQLPVRYTFSSLLPESHAQNGNIVDLVATRPVVRLCCINMRQEPYEQWSPNRKSNFCKFDLSPALSIRLIQISAQEILQNYHKDLQLMFVAPLAEFWSLTGMILDEIWEDAHNQLTAWGRLYTRACFRRCFKYYWRYKE